MDLLTSTFAPPSGPWMTAMAAIQCVLVVVNGLNEYTNPTPYSKFANNNTGNTNTTTIPSRQGMLLLYAPSVLAALAFGVYSDTAIKTRAIYLVGLHFAKRVLESLFLHKYSGSMELGASLMIGTFYALVSSLVIATAQPWNASDVQLLGIAMFVVGEMGNLYHHYLLRLLRTESKDKKNDNKRQNKRYVPPTGGLFDYVVAPHYLFEIFAFVGIALVAQSLHALLVALGMASYLTGRACRTLKFYLNTFDKAEFSREKKALIPFLF